MCAIESNLAPLCLHFIECKSESNMDLKVRKRAHTESADVNTYCNSVVLFYFFGPSSGVWDFILFHFHFQRSPSAHYLVNQHIINVKLRANQEMTNRNALLCERRPVTIKPSFDSLLLFSSSLWPSLCVCGCVCVFSAHVCVCVLGWGTEGLCRACLCGWTLGFTVKTTKKPRTFPK